VKQWARSCASRVTRAASTYCGKSGANRFDDPAGGYGVCYLGLGKGKDGLMVAFAESVLHDQTATDGGFDVAVSELESQQVVRFAPPGKLRLADLTGAALKRIGLDGRISTITPYDMPQSWSAAIHAHPDKVDGIAYVSRHYNLGVAVALFDRAKERLVASSYTPIPKTRYFAALCSNFGLRPL